MHHLHSSPLDISVLCCLSISVNYEELFHSIDNESYFPRQSVETKHRQQILDNIRLTRQIVFLVGCVEEHLWIFKSDSIKLVDSSRVFRWNGSFSAKKNKDF